MMRLNWGCAMDRYEGWIGSDVADYGQDHVGDILKGLPWKENTFDFVVTHHALQIIKYVDLPEVIADFRRVLKPGGILRGSVPDVLAAFDAHQRGDHEWFPIVDPPRKSIDGKFSAYLTWYSEARSAFTPGYLLELLNDEGFTAAGIVNYRGSMTEATEHLELDKRPKESLFFEAVK